MVVFEDGAIDKVSTGVEVHVFVLVCDQKISPEQHVLHLLAPFRTRIHEV